jgi:predicted nuclease of predicted toxin-antitoxin system
VTVWLDANLDPDLAPWLGSRYNVFVQHVRELGLQRVDDRQLFAAAGRLNVNVVLTKDSDLVDLVILHGPPPHVIRLTCGNLSTPAMQGVLQRTFADALALLAGGAPWVEIG